MVVATFGVAVISMEAEGPAAAELIGTAIVAGVDPNIEDGRASEPETASKGTAEAGRGAAAAAPEETS